MNNLPPRIQAALDKLEPEMEKAFLDAIERITSRVELEKLIAQIERGNVNEAINSLGLDPSYFAPLDRAIAESYWQGGYLTMDSIPRFSSAVIGFNLRAPAAEAWVRSRSSTLITGIIDDEREAVRLLLTEGIKAGQHPRTVALDIVGRIDRTTGRRSGGIIGLTGPGASAVLAARAQLESGDPAMLKAYLSRSLRDARFDSKIKAALRTGKPLSKADIDAMVNRYSDRLLKYRGQMIARTEAITALGAGQHEGYAQLVEKGALKDSQIKRVWQSTGDNRTRKHHILMNGQVRYGINTPFEAPNGVLMKYPRDTSIPSQDGRALAGEVIQCRCYEKFEIDFLGVGFKK